VEDSDELREMIADYIKRPVEVDAPNRESVPMPPSKYSDIKSQLDVYRDLRAQISLDASNLPSICCYTFHNTANTLL
jgi:transcription initiation factor TFIID subunit 5